MQQPPPPDAAAFLGAELPAPRRVRWGLGDFFLAFIAGFVAAIVVSSVYVAVAVALSGRGLDSSQTSTQLADVAKSPWFIAVALFAQNGAIVGVLAIVARWKGRGSLADFGWRWRFPARDLVWILVGVGLQLVVIVVLLPISLVVGGDSQQTVVESLEGPVSLGLVVALLGAAFVAPFTEELLFRGLLLRSLQRRLAVGQAVAISSVVFAFVHVLGDPKLGSLVALPGLFVVGAICGIRAVRTGSIVQSVFIHVGFNSATAVALFVAALLR